MTLKSQILQSQILLACLAIGYCLSLPAFSATNTPTGKIMVRWDGTNMTAGDYEFAFWTNGAGPTGGGSVTNLTDLVDVYFPKTLANNGASLMWIHALSLFGPSTYTPCAVTNTAATSVSVSAATLNGNVLSVGFGSAGLITYWGDDDGTTNAWDNTLDCGAASVGAFSTNISGLTMAKTYYYRSKITNQWESAWASPSASFSTSLWEDPNEASLVARYWFDPTATNAAGLIPDSSGLGNDATNKPTFATGPTWTILGTNTLGRVEDGYSFDFSDDYIWCGSPFNEAFTNDFSVAVWVNVDAARSYAKILCGGPVVSATYSPCIDLSAGGLTPRLIYTWDAGAHYDVLNGSAIPTTTWVHLVYTHTIATNIYYTNGVYCAGAAATHHAEANTTGVRLGVVSTTTQLYDGKMDDVRIYKAALSASDVAALYQNTNPTNNLEARP